MSEEKVPRRLRRFYRQKESNDYQENNYDDYDYSPQNNSYQGHLPTMEYEDVDEKNLDEIKKTEINNLEEKLALLEIEKFKKENKRLPNKQEQDTLANNLYEQFKNDPEHEEIENNRPVRGRHRDRGHIRKEANENKDEEMNLETDTGISEPTATSNTSDIKSLFGDSAPKKNKKDDFDLGLDLDENNELDMGDDLAELEDFSLDGKKKKKKQN